jgi:hypothetical protein
MSDKHARGLDAETRSCFMHGDYTGKETCPGCWIDVASVAGEHKKGTKDCLTVDGGFHGALKELANKWRERHYDYSPIDCAEDLITLLAAESLDATLAISVDDLARDFVKKAKRYQSEFITESTVRAWFKFVIAYGFYTPTLTPKLDATPDNLPPPMAFRDAFEAMATAAGDDDALRRLRGPADPDKEPE